MRNSNIPEERLEVIEGYTIKMVKDIFTKGLDIVIHLVVAGVRYSIDKPELY